MEQTGAPGPSVEQVMAAARELVLAALEELSQEQLKRFRHKLRNLPGQGRTIPWGRLERADALDLAEQLTQFYGPEPALDVTRKALKRADVRDVAARLKEQRLQRFSCLAPLSVSEYKKLFREHVLREHAKVRERNARSVKITKRFTKLLIAPEVELDTVLGLDFELGLDAAPWPDATPGADTEPQAERARRSDTHTFDRLFRPDPDGRQKLTVVLQGPAGIGKTMAARKILYDWAAGKLYRGQVDFAFFLPCRELLDRPEACSLADLLLDGCPDRRAPLRAMLARPERLLFILDGADELPAHAPGPCADPFQPAGPERVLAALLGRALLPGARLLLTARARPAPPRGRLWAPQCAEVRGFSHKDRKKFFYKFFQDEARAARAYRLVKEDAPLLSLCSVPFVCWLVCTVLRQQLDGGRGLGRAGRTTTSLYLLFTASMLGEPGGGAGGGGATGTGANGVRAGAGGVDGGVTGGPRGEGGGGAHGVRAEGGGGANVAGGGAGAHGMRGGGGGGGVTSGPRWEGGGGASGPTLEGGGGANVAGGGAGAHGMRAGGGGGGVTSGPRWEGGGGASGPTLEGGANVAGGGAGAHGMRALGGGGGVTSGPRWEGGGGASGPTLEGGGGANVAGGGAGAHGMRAGGGGGGGAGTGEPRPQVLSELLRLSLLARQGVLGRQLRFSEADLAQLQLGGSRVQALFLGRKELPGVLDTQVAYQFLDPSFQEFLAALSFLLEEPGAGGPGVGALLRADALRPHLALTTRFLFGLVSAERARDMQRLLGVGGPGSERVRQQVLAWAQGVGAGEAGRTPAEAEDADLDADLDEDLDEDEDEDKEDQAGSGEPPGCPLELLHCLYETQEAAFVRQVLTGLPELALRRVRFSHTDMAVLAHCVRCCPAGQALRLDSCRLAMAPEKKKKGLVKRLQGGLGGSPARSSKKKPLVSLLRPLCEAMADRQCGLSSLMLSGCKMPDTVCRDLAEAVSRAPSLTELALLHNGLSEAGLRVLSESLTQPGCRVRTLRVQQPGLQGPLQRLVSMLRLSPALTALDLGGCQLSGSLVSSLCALLRDPGCSLLTLSLGSGELSEQSLRELRAVRTARPGLVITHPELDGQQEPSTGYGSVL